MLQFTLKVGSKTLVSCGMNRKFQCKSFREVLIFSNKEKTRVCIQVWQFRPKVKDKVTTATSHVSRRFSETPMLKEEGTR